MRAVLLRWLFGCHLALAGLLPGAAAAAAVELHVFWQAGCPHCARELAFLARLEAEEADLAVHRYDIGGDPRHRALFERLVATLEVAEPAVPLTLIGDHYLIGFDAADTTGARLRALVGECRVRHCPDRLAELSVGRKPASPTAALLPDRLRLPLLGEVDPRAVSLPLLTVLLGAIDGFNPCAMWVLVFLIGLLGGLRDRTRMWLLGGLFLAASAFAYYLFMAAWLSLLLFLGAALWMRFLVGAVALAGGGYYLREYFANPGSACKVTAPERRRRVLERLKAIAGERNFWLAAAGIVLLAFAVNLIELACSAGIPAVYTQVLALNALPAWQYHGYLALYILIFLLDDLLVFAAALLAVEAAGLGGRYLRAARLIGALVLIALGLLLLLRPGWLAFG